MTAFFTVDDNSFDIPGLPWIEHVTSGLQTGNACGECGATRIDPVGDLLVTLENRESLQWPDVLGCGAASLLIVTGRVLDAWRDDHIGVFPVHTVNVAPPIPGPLDTAIQPDYFWIDGEKMQVA